MLTGTPPWSEYEVYQVMFKVATELVVPSLPEKTTESCKDFVRSCLKRYCL